jgi:hypothetical protein
MPRPSKTIPLCKAAGRQLQTMPKTQIITSLNNANRSLAQFPFQSFCGRRPMSGFLKKHDFSHVASASVFRQRSA